MKNKKLLLGAMGIAVIGGVSTLVPLGVYAAENSEEVNTFVQKLAARLGMEESAIESAVENVRVEIHDERSAERETALSQAVIDGTLTERQAQILNGLDEAMQATRPGEGERLERKGLSSLTQEQREAQFSEQKEEREQEVVDALNEQGLNTTIDELESTREAARNANIDLGIRIGKGRGVPHPRM